MDELIESRKADHLRLSAAGDVDALVGAGWEDVRLVHEALPDVELCCDIGIVRAAAPTEHEDLP